MKRDGFPQINRFIQVDIDMHVIRDFIVNKMLMVE